MTKHALFLQKDEHVEAGQAIHIQADQADIRIFRETGERIYVKGQWDDETQRNS